MTLALYCKYRPKKLEDLVGQETNASILRSAAANNRLGHAYLFYGSRGTGKTTSARLLAKLYNCQKRQNDKNFALTGEPCNDCVSCQEIDAGSSLDVIEMDAASNRGIDEIRNLKESIRTSPAHGPYKVYIIDEAHMLTGAAFNALLKTLEEPPAHGAIIMATTEYDKLPATITSRAQRFLFKKLTKNAVIEKLQRIVKVEKIKIDEDALELIAAEGEGSLRDAESLLDQMRAAGDKITLEIVAHLTGRTGLKTIHDIATALIDKNPAKALELLNKASDEGYNISTLTKDLIHYLRKIISLKTNDQLEKFFLREFTKEEMENVKKLADKIEPAKHAKLLHALITAYTEIRYSPFALIPLEIVIAEHLT